MKKKMIYTLLALLFTGTLSAYAQGAITQPTNPATETATDPATAQPTAPMAEGEAVTAEEGDKVQMEPVLSSSPEQLWDEGNRYYIDGDFESARKCYEQIIGEGYSSAKLWYNAANCCFKTGALGRAILYYHRALEAAPAMEDARYNLAIAQQQTKDRIAEVPEFFLVKWVRAVRNSMSCTAWSILSLVAFALMLGFVLLFLLAQRLGARKAGFYGTIAALLVAVVTTSMALAERSEMLSREGAIVISSAISVKSSPDRSATDIFVLHEGTKVRVVGEIEGWSEIVIADGKKGWTESRNVEKI